MINEIKINNFYTKAAWERVIKYIKINNFYTKVACEWVIKKIMISNFPVVAMLQGYDQTWGARNVLCKKSNLHIA